MTRAPSILNDPSRRWVLILLVIDGLLAAMNVITFAVTRAFDLAPVALFRLSGEANVPTWWSSAQLLMIALVLGVVAWHLGSRPTAQAGGRWQLWMPVALFALLSLDEVAQLHENVGHTYGPIEMRTGMWVIICVPLFLVALALVTRGIWPHLRDYPAVVRRFVTGISLLLLSAVGVELLANLFPDGSIATHICVVVEELGEMIAATVMLWAAVEWAQASGIRLSRRAPSTTLPMQRESRGVSMGVPVFDK